MSIHAMRPETDVRFLPVELTCKRWYHDRRHDEASLFLDPILWSDDGASAPSFGTVWSVEDGSWMLENSCSDRYLTNWRYLCRGKNAANAVKELIEPENDRYDISDFLVGDVIEKGYIRSDGGMRYSSRTCFVIMEIGEDRLVVHQMPTLAKAMRLGNGVKQRLASQPDRFRRRRETWEEAQRPRTIEEDLDDAAIEDAFL